MIPTDKQHGVIPRQAGDHTVKDDLPPIGLRQERLDHIAQRDHARAPADERLELAEPLALERQDHEHGDPGDRRRREHGHAGQQGDADRRPEELGQVGRHRRDLLGDPQGSNTPTAAKRARHISARFRPVAMPELGRETLNQHRHHVRHQNDPQEGVPELRPTLDVRREVPRVDVGDARDEGRPDEGQDRAQPAGLPLDRVARRELDLRVRQGADVNRSSSIGPCHWTPSSALMTERHIALGAYSVP